MNRERKAEFNKSIILNAAEELFQQKGFENTRIDEIAEKAEISKATIYSYFNCKEELLDRLLHKALRNICEQIKNCLNEKLGRGEYFMKICNIFVNFYKTNQVCFQRMLQPLDEKYTGPTSLLYEQIAEDTHEINALLYDAMKKYNVTKFFQGDNPDKGTFLIWTTVIGTILISERKEGFIKMMYGISAEEFREFSFRQLYEASVVEK